MIKTKKNGLLKVACTMLAVTMLATCVISGTLAKYTSSASLNTASVTAATWSVLVGGGANNDIAKGDFSLADLSWTIQPIFEGTENEAVEDGKIAPGTWGYAAITITNESEVDANITVTGLRGDTFTPTEKPNSAGLTFKCVAMSDVPTSYDTATTPVGTNLTTGVKLDKNGGTTVSTTIYLCYQWLYDAGAGVNDENDVKDAGQTFHFGSIEITATQVQPEKNA